MTEGRVLETNTQKNPQLKTWPSHVKCSLIKSINYFKLRVKIKNMNIPGLETVH